MSIAEVKAFEQDDDGKGGDVKVDRGGGNVLLAEHYAPPGDDSPPLPGDWVATTDASETGSEAAVGYVDPLEQKAAPGEKRVYARAGEGEDQTLVAEVWLHSDGTVTVRNMLAPEGTGEVEIAADGRLSVKGHVTSEPAGPGSDVTLATLQIPSPFGPLGPPIPGS